MSQSQHGTSGDAVDPWFDNARILDQEWVELSVKTPAGNQVLYRIPRRTLFEKVDQAAQ